MTNKPSWAPWGGEPEIEWDEGNEGHATGHGITRSEIEDLILVGEYDWWRHPKHGKQKKGSRSVPNKYWNRFLIRGLSEGGRLMIVVVARVAEKKLRPITAMEVQKNG